MPEISLYFLNDTAYSDTIYDPLFTFVGNASLLKYMIYCDVDCDFGFRWCVDSQFQVISTDTYSLTGGTEQSIIVPITSCYVIKLKTTHKSVESQAAKAVVGQTIY